VGETIWNRTEYYLQHFPLHRIQHLHLQQEQQEAIHPTGAGGGGGGGGDGGPPDQDQPQKLKFIMFMRVLMKYLGTKDPTLYQQAKHVIQDCADRNRRNEEGYESVTTAMRERLQELVGKTYWERTEIYLEHFLEQKRQIEQRQQQEQQEQQQRQEENVVGG